MQNARDLTESAYLRGCGFFARLDHPEAGSHDYPGLPFHLDRTPGGQVTAAPCFGEHTHRILRDLLGFDPDAIARLDAVGVISTTPV